MKIRITVEFDDRLRRAINAYHSEPGLANYGVVKKWLETQLHSAVTDMVFALNVSEGDNKWRGGL